MQDVGEEEDHCLSKEVLWSQLVIYQNWGNTYSEFHPHQEDARSNLAALIVSACYAGRNNSYDFRLFRMLMSQREPTL